MPAEPKARVITDILEEHLEELAFLWMQRSKGVHAADYTQKELAELEERIEAHLQGLLVGGDAVLPFVEEALSSDDPWDVFAAVYTLLRLNTDSSIARAVDALRTASAEIIPRVCDAFCFAPIDRVENELKAILSSAEPAVAVAAAQALLHHGRLDARNPQLFDFFGNDDVEIRRSAWKIVCLSGQ